MQLPVLIPIPANEYKMPPFFLLFHEYAPLSFDLYKIISQ